MVRAGARSHMNRQFALSNMTNRLPIRCRDSVSRRNPATSADKLYLFWQTLIA